MPAEMSDKQRDLLIQIIEVSNRTDSGTCPNIYSRAGNSLRALARRGLVTYEEHWNHDFRQPFSSRRVSYSATPTDAGREAVQS